MLVEELIAELTPYADKGIHVIMSSDEEGNSYEELRDVGEPVVWLYHHGECEVVYEDDGETQVTVLDPAICDEIGCDPRHLFLGIGLWP